MEAEKQQILRLVKQVAVREGVNETGMPGVYGYKITQPDTIMPAVYEPCLCVILQGRKKVLLGTQSLDYGAFEFLVASVDLPVLGKVIEASTEQPYYVLQVNLDTGELSELLLKMQFRVRGGNRSERGLFIGESSPALLKSLNRLMSLTETPEDASVLGSAFMREVYYRVLQSEYGNEIAKLSLGDSPTQRIARVIQNLRHHYDRSFHVDELAGMAGMSVSSFHAHFKAITTMSPLQFQKSVRLVEARNLMISRNLDAATTAYKVGYESPSQFSREYARMFGNPPARDIATIRAQYKG